MPANAQQKNYAITDAERQLVVDGNIQGFWESRLAAGDPVARACLAFGWQAFALGAFAGAAGAIANGADILAGALLGGVSGLAFAGVNGVEFGTGFGAELAQFASFGAVGGVTAVLAGGKFGHGFIAAGAGGTVGGKIDNIGGSGGGAIRTATRTILGGTISKLTGGKFANGAGAAAFASLMREAAQRTGARSNAQKGDGFFKRLWKKATGWHFEGRVGKNGNLPSYGQVADEGSAWDLLSPEQSIFHDDGIGKAELKFVHPDGGEAVFNGDTLNLVTDSKYLGTYNYVNSAPKPENWYNVGGWGAYAGKGLGHFVLDVVPYAIGGNVRGPD